MGISSLSKDLLGLLFCSFSGTKEELDKQFSTVALVCSKWREASQIAIAKKLINTGMIKVTAVELRVAKAALCGSLSSFHFNAGKSVSLLDLSDLKNSPEGQVITAIERYPGVHTVILNKEKLSRETVTKMAALANLKSLIISCGKEFEDSDLEPLAAAKNLQHLELKGFEKIGGSFLRALNLTGLFNFTLTCASSLKEDALDELWKLTNLKCLNLSFSTLHHFSVASKALESLDLLNSTFADPLSPMGEIESLTNLRHLSLTLDSKQPESLGKLKLLRNLRLDKCNHLTDVSFKASYKCRLIETLELKDCNQLTRISLEYIVDNSPYLKSLTLKTCTKMFEGIPVDFSPLSQLTELQIWHCFSLTEEGLAAIIQALPKLVKITLNNLPLVDFEKIKHQYPHLTVT